MIYDMTFQQYGRFLRELHVRKINYRRKGIKDFISHSIDSDEKIIAEIIKEIIDGRKM